MPPPTTDDIQLPKEHVMKIMDMNESIMACPAIMLAKRRTISAKGLEIIPNISMTGMIGKG